MNTREREAIDYCRSLGLDPHELVFGWNGKDKYVSPRWGWYMGARAGQ